MEEKSGSRFGNYELVSRIDIGGMGEVYMARQLTAFSRTVAIKIIRSDLVHDVTARARFLREAEVSAHLKHEHILPLFDFGEVDGRLFLVTPYIEGGTLAARLKSSGPMTLVETRKLFVPLVQAVAYIHRRGVVHRDLKPTNVMLDTEDGEVYVRLIDFGIATLQGRSASPPLTTAGHEIGTVAYMAPERLSGVAAPSNDIFSLGVILHQMLTARMPTAAPQKPDSVVPRLPEPLAQVVRRAVASNLAERYASAEELLKAFEQAYQQVIKPASSDVLATVSEGAALTTSRPTPDQSLAHSRPELVSLAHSGELPAFGPQISPHSPKLSFAPEDYNAPTTSFRQPPPIKQVQTNRPPLIRPRQPKPSRGARRSSLFLILPAATVLVLVVLAALLYYGFQVVDAASVAVNFAPQVRAISQVVTLKADPNAHKVNVGLATIPALPLTIQKATQQTGDTTGQVNCVFGGIGCQQGVSQDDVNNLVAQMQPGLEQSIADALRNQISAKRGMPIGSVNFSTPTIDAQPPVDAPAKSVTVMLTEQGSIGYFLKGDATTVVRQELVAAVMQLGQRYQMIDSTVDIGQTVLQSIDQNTGVSTLVVPAGVVARYQFSQAQLLAISNGLVGKPLAAAESFLKSQPGIDPASVSIHFTSGSGQTMPSDTQRIRLIQLAPGTLPAIKLTPASGLTPVEDTPAPTPTNTPTDDGQ